MPPFSHDMNEQQPEIERVLKLSQLQMEQGKAARALETLDAATGAVREHWNYWYNRSWAYFELKRYPEGIEAAQRGMWLAPERGSLFWMLALNQHESGAIDHARVTLWRGLRQNPDHIYLFRSYAVENKESRMEG